MDENLPLIEFAFPGPLRDKIVNAILSGKKSATSSLLWEYEVSNEPIPKIGFRGRVVNSQGKHVCSIETVAVRIMSLGEVTDEHARAEGADFQSASAWREAHERFWDSAAMRAELGENFSLNNNSQVVLERFVVIQDQKP